MTVPKPILWRSSSNPDVWTSVLSVEPFCRQAHIRVTWSGDDWVEVIMSDKSKVRIRRLSRRALWRRRALRELKTQYRLAQAH